MSYTMSGTAALRALHHLNPQSRASSRLALRLVSRNKNIRFKRHRTADVNGIHPA